MKKFFNKIGKPTKDVNYQAKAVKHMEKLEKGEVKMTSAPRYPAEVKHFENAQMNAKIRENLNKKNEILVENMNKMRITSTDPPERWTSTKELPTRESELLHRHDRVWEYGFYEPPLEKIPPQKIMLREAVEVLRMSQEANAEGNSEAAVKMRKEASLKVDEHVATVRIGKDKVNLLYEYFRPFERREEQKVVCRNDLARLQDALQGRGDEFSLSAEAAVKMRRLIEKEQKEIMATKMDGNEDLYEKINKLRNEENERLKKIIGEDDQDPKKEESKTRGRKEE